MRYENKMEGRTLNTLEYQPQDSIFQSWLCCFRICLCDRGVLHPVIGSYNTQGNFPLYMYDKGTAEAVPFIVFGMIYSAFSLSRNL